MRRRQAPRGGAILFFCLAWVLRQLRTLVLLPPAVCQRRGAGVGQSSGSQTIIRRRDSWALTNFAVCKGLPPKNQILADARRAYRTPARAAWDVHDRWPKGCDLVAEPCPACATAGAWRGMQRATATHANARRASSVRGRHDCRSRCQQTWSPGSVPTRSQGALATCPPSAVRVLCGTFHGWCPFTCANGTSRCQLAVQPRCGSSAAIRARTRLRSPHYPPASHCSAVSPRPLARTHRHRLRRTPLRLSCHCTGPSSTWGSALRSP